MPSVANTSKVRYVLHVRWANGTEQRIPARYHERVSIGPLGPRPPVAVHLGPRTDYAKVVVEIHGDEIPAVVLEDTDVTREREEVQ